MIENTITGYTEKFQKLKFEWIYLLLKHKILRWVPTWCMANHLMKNIQYIMERLKLVNFNDELESSCILYALLSRTVLTFNSYNKNVIINFVVSHFSFIRRHRRRSHPRFDLHNRFCSQFACTNSRRQYNIALSRTIICFFIFIRFLPPE